MVEPETPAPIITGSVWTTLELIGFHSWPKAPNQVNHLRARHRHVFSMRVELGVDHPDRAIEFQILQAVIGRWFVQTFPNSGGGNGGGGIAQFEFGNLSCESIAQALIGMLVDFYPGASPYEVSVSEDGENGATVRYVQP